VQAKKRGKKKLGHRYSINTIVQATSSWHSSSGSIGSPESFLSAQSQKLSLEAFLHTALLSLCQPARSLANWAASLSALQGQIFSKQALHKRCHSRSRSLVQHLLAGHLGRVGSQARAPELFQAFSRVLLQDSTTLPLCRALASAFPANGNHSLRYSSALKLHAVLELLSQRWVCFQLSPFTRTDQAAAAYAWTGFNPATFSYVTWVMR